MSWNSMGTKVSVVMAFSFCFVMQYQGIACQSGCSNNASLWCDMICIINVPIFQYYLQSFTPIQRHIYT